MKIYWKNLIWNYTGRYWCKLKFRGKSKSWKNYYCTKLIWNSKQKIELERKLRNHIIDFQNQHWKDLKRLNHQIWNDPLIHIPLEKRKNDRKDDKS